MDTASAASSTTTIAPAKNHYVILDGLRGVASLMVVAFHLFEPFSGGNPVKQIINHGYLAVDFFFMLSGFVIAYAYDDRWTRMTQLEFYKRRLIRLQPMVIMGSLVGAALFFFSDGPGISLDPSHPCMEDAAGHARGLHPASSPDLDGYPGLAGDASAQWSGLVAFL